MNTINKIKPLEKTLIAESRGNPMKNNDLKQIIPFNLQFFAEPEPSPEPTPTSEPKPEPSPEPKETMEQIVERLMIENKKLKTASDNNSKEAAEYKRKLNAKLTEDEKRIEEKAEAELKREEEFQTLKKKVTISEAEKRYLELGYPTELAAKAAEAEFDNDYATATNIQKQFLDLKLKSAEAEWIKTRPMPKNGTGEDGETKDPFMEGFGL